MSEITIPKHFLIPLLLTFLCLILVISRKKNIVGNGSRNLFITAIVFLSTYLIIVGNSLFHDIYYQLNVNQYDLNKDGMFTGSEINTDQTNALEKSISDNGRNFSFITGLIFASIVSCFSYFLLLIKSKFRKK